MQKGDIILVRFPFTDLSSEKLRPALILSDESKSGDFILAFITTQLGQQEKHDILLSANYKDFQQTGLKKESILKLNKLTALNKRIILGKIGSLSSEVINQVNSNLKSLLKL